ncbi:FAD-binding oxidoreductase [Sphaerisporangium sp. B11E5]|uniref:FAD-binding oxidoreductase n=1 Tax=Sphaerisporangium sp. B11E5 TaxID=3153563 RepID=UPI00325DFDFB
MRPDLTPLGAAVRDWRRRVGAEHVLTDPPILARYGTAVCGQTRDVPAVVRPATAAQVRGVVAAARRHGVPLYPISRGRNWGLGSRLPVRDGTAVLDLSRLDAIREFDEDAHVVVVEPGVTQSALCAFLGARAPWAHPNVTGSSTDSSVLGNLLDRGVGYLSPRMDDLVALEAVLGNGRLLRTGHWGSPGLMGHRWPHGVGPSLNGLFTQSSLGVVTAAAVRVRPRPRRQYGVAVTVGAEDGLRALIDGLRLLHVQETVRTVSHVFDTSRLRTSLNLDGGVWTAFLTAGGSPAVADACRADIEAVLGPVGDVHIEELDPSAAPAPPEPDPVLAARRGVFDLMLGRPTDKAVELLLARSGEPYSPGRVDLSRAGTVFCVQAVPLAGEAACHAVTLARHLGAEHGFEPSVSLNAVSPHTMEFVVNVLFDRREPREAARARAYVTALHHALMAAGFAPYRLGVQDMDVAARPGDAFWDTVADLKHALDPAGIVAPGRYTTV